VRASDTVARIGGDEFAVLVEGVTSSEAGEVVAAKIVVALEAPFRLAEGRGRDLLQRRRGDASGRRRGRGDAHAQRRSRDVPRERGGQGTDRALDGALLTGPPT
jgi:GGDEF domain-containing protein